MNEITRIAQANPPGNLAGLQVVNSKVEDSFLNLQLHCSCGEKLINLHAGKGKEENLWLDPVAFSCKGCGQKKEIFNSVKDGYDAKLCGVATHLQNFEQEIVKCPDCNHDDLSVEVGLSYNVEYDELVELVAEYTKEKGVSLSLSDLYDSFFFIVTCGDCQKIFYAGEWELA